jgi:hypothetical protein
MPMILTDQQHREALSRATSNMNAQEELTFLRAFVVELEKQVDRLLRENLQLRAEFAELDMFVREPSPSAMAN